MPNNTVRSLLVDSNNILWIGTENGVVKKENDVFTNFFEEDGLALNSCWAIAEDKNKNLWFGSYGEGVSIYNGNDFKVISEEQGLVHGEITKLFTHGNYMYVGTSDGVSIININSFEVLSLNNHSDDDLFRVQDFFKYRDEIYVVTYNTGIFKIVSEDDQPALLKVNDIKYNYSVFVDNDSIYNSNKGFFTKNSIGDFANGRDTIQSKKLGVSIIWDHVKSKDYKIFAAAWGIYDTNGGIYEIVNNTLISRASDFNISSKKVISLAYDARFEKLYVGTKDAGLFEVKLNPQIKFNEIQGKNVLGFARTNNSSAVLLDDGILLKDAGKQRTINLAQLKKWQEEYVLNTKLALPKHQDSFYELDYSTKAIDISFYDIKVSQNRYWVNTNIGVFAIKPSGALDRYLPLHSEEINFTEAGDLIETNPYGGLRIYSDLDTFKYTHFKQEDPETPTMVVNSLQKDLKTYFLSVFSGLYVLENKEFKSYLHNGIWKEKKLRHITTLGKNIAISSEFGDVFILNDEGSFKLLNKIPRAKIQGNTISFLKEYKGYLLIGTEKGLTLYKNERYIFLDEEQGLKQVLLSAEVDENNLKIGSKNGYYSIDLEAISDPKLLVSRLKLEEIFINNNKFPFEHLADKGKVKLSYNENTVLLKFSTNAHPNPHKLSYQYRLNANDSWNLPTSKPEIFLPFLPADKYNVTVRVIDASTGLNYTQTLLKFTILPPFWKTWWFILLIIGLVGLVVYSAYNYEIRQTRKFQEQKSLIQKRFEETKMEALLAQMNPHFIFNAMNSIQNYIMDSDVDNASIFLGDFAKLIRLNLDHCTKPTILLVEEIEYLSSYIRVENTRFSNRIKVIIEIDPSIDVYELEIPTMILQTFVENVFVHAFPPSITKPSLTVTFKLMSENVLQCKIADNGIGFSPNSTNSLHNSKGVNLVKERLLLLGHNIDHAVQIESTKNKGTVVTISLKV
ncbi:sensor histidine kinase [Gillisia mitskevichiae]|uniref:sensor histidine kinase n=1 Tax=Gillisia mitskevichiae TaxID=270921 RepID=UPI000EAF44A9|nr:histidine kinase [Gillisia mitskevichiae]